MKKIILIINCIISFSLASGQVTFQKTYGSTLYDEGSSIVQMSDGGFIVIGTTQVYTVTSYSDVFLMRTDSMGDTLWTKIFRGTNPDYGTSVCLTPSGEIIICGYTISFGSTSYNIYLTKIDINGSTIWTRIINGGFDD